MSDDNNKNTRSKGDQVRHLIVETANRLFYEGGYNHTSFTDIVDATDVQRGNIYYYFKTKDDILRAVIDHRLEVITDMLNGWNREEKDPRVRLHNFARMLLENSNDLIRFGCPMGTINAELGKGQRELQRITRAMFDTFRDWLIAQYRQLGANSRLADELAMETLARAQGIIMVAHVYEDADVIEREIPKFEAWLRKTTDAIK